MASSLKPFLEGSKWGYKNQTGQVVIPPQFNWAESFSNGFARVCTGKNSLYIDKTGQEVSQTDVNNRGDVMVVIPLKRNFKCYKLLINISANQEEKSEVIKEEYKPENLEDRRRRRRSSSRIPDSK